MSGTKPKKGEKGLKLIIPKGMVGPNDTTIVEIPESYKKQDVVIAKRNEVYASSSYEASKYTEAASSSNSRHQAFSTSSNPQYPPSFATSTPQKPPYSASGNSQYPSFFDSSYSQQQSHSTLPCRKIHESASQTPYEERDVEKLLEELESYYHSQKSFLQKSTTRIRSNRENTDEDCQNSQIPGMCECAQAASSEYGTQSSTDCNQPTVIVLHNKNCPQGGCSSGNRQSSRHQNCNRGCSSYVSTDNTSRRKERNKADDEDDLGRDSFKRDTSSHELLKGDRMKKRSSSKSESEIMTDTFTLSNSKIQTDPVHLNESKTLTNPVYYSEPKMLNHSACCSEPKILAFPLCCSQSNILTDNDLNQFKTRLDELKKNFQKTQELCMVPSCPSKKTVRICDPKCTGTE